MLSHDAYFERLDRPIRVAMLEFGRAYRRLRLFPQEVHAQASLLKAANEMLRMAFEICEIAPPPAAFETMVDFIGGVRALVAAEVVNDERIADCLSRLRALLVALDGDKSLVVLEHPGQAAALAFIRDTVGDLCRHLFGHYGWQTYDPRLVHTRFKAAGCEALIPAASLELLKGLPRRLKGWCSYDKAVLLYTLVRRHRPEKAVEIGIFGGRSIVPIALGLRDNQFGEVVGIESWSAEPATAFRTTLANDFWWATLDFAQVKRAFLAYIVEEDLHPYIRLLETASNRAIATLDEIHFAHIDGGHSTLGAAQDVAAVLAKMPSGGVVLFDDIDWTSTAPALELLMGSCRLVDVVAVSQEEERAGCAAFVKL
ncbi:MAG TPA: class I SAM-dependent methyltransferase [Reyranella sp.]|nr:class I SAM-dependent methyltransferase [Reyranella sp.]